MTTFPAGVIDSRRGYVGQPGDRSRSGAIQWRHDSFPGCQHLLGKDDPCRGKSTRTVAAATSALEKATVPYAVIGGNAVASWVSAVDEAAVRNTQDVDLLLRRTDLEVATAALSAPALCIVTSPAWSFFSTAPKPKAGCRPRRFCGREGTARIRTSGSRRCRIRTGRIVSRAGTGSAGTHEVDLVSPEGSSASARSVGRRADRRQLVSAFPAAAGGALTRISGQPTGMISET